MKIKHIICSFNTPHLTERIYNELKKQTDDIIVLDNSTTEDKIFQCKELVDLGRRNLGFGGMHDWIWAQKKLLKYDFVAIYNNDVYNLPNNWISTLPNYLSGDIGVAVPALNDDGTGWQHMRKKGNWYREAQHCEDAIGIFNTKLFNVYKSYSPMDFFGVLDISLCLLSTREGYRNIIVDALPVTHMLAGARKDAKVFDTYIARSASSINEWHSQFPDLQKLYRDYINKYDGVSVIIPNYNHNNLLRRAVDSVLAQPIKTEVVVVDDCSPDQDYSMLDGLANVRLVKHDKNKGLAAARNTGIKDCYHEWILPLDADDELISGSLKHLFDNRSVDIICGHLQYRNGGILQSKENINAETFLRDNQLVGSTLYHKDVWRNINGYLEDPKEYFEDWCFWGRAAMRGYKFKTIDQLIYKYTGPADGMCARLNRKRNYNVELVTGLIREYKEWLETQSNNISNSTNT